MNYDTRCTRCRKLAGWAKWNRLFSCNEGLVCKRCLNRQAKREQREELGYDDAPFSFQPDPDTEGHML